MYLNTVPIFTVGFLTTWILLPNKNKKPCKRIFACPFIISSSLQITKDEPIKYIASDVRLELIFSCSYMSKFCNVRY